MWKASSDKSGDYSDVDCEAAVCVALPDDMGVQKSYSNSSSRFVCDTNMQLEHRPHIRLWN